LILGDLLLILLLAAVEKDFRGGFQGLHSKGTPIKLEAHVLEDFLDGSALVGAGWQFIQGTHFLLQLLQSGRELGKASHMDNDPVIKYKSFLYLFDLKNLNIGV